MKADKDLEEIRQRVEQAEEKLERMIDSLKEREHDLETKAAGPESMAMPKAVEEDTPPPGPG
jgi:hypothetical protein